MTLDELKAKIKEYQYFEDDRIIDVSTAAIVATRLGITDPLWIVIIGASSGGKSQILRPLSLTDDKFLHRIDDLTENTFLSGMGGKSNNSLLHRIGARGILVMSDLTVLFSKNSESKNAILSQFRMLYDGEMIKHSGSKDKPLHWKGRLGVLAGSTPSIYRHFEEVADMGERFIYWRMKDFDRKKATKLALRRILPATEIDTILAEYYAEYIKYVVQNCDKALVVIPEDIEDRIIDVANFAEKVRTSTRMDFRESYIDDIPVPAYPMRVSLQLLGVLRGLAALRQVEGLGLTPYDAEIVEWMAYSLGNEKKRAVLKVLGTAPYGVNMSTQLIADKIGLATEPINKVLQNLAAVKVVKRDGDSNGLVWRIEAQDEWEIVRRIEGINDDEEIVDRALSSEESSEGAQAANLAFDELSKIGEA